MKRAIRVVLSVILGLAFYVAIHILIEHWKR